jgi:hypothetical protein
MRKLVFVFVLFVISNIAGAMALPTYYVTDSLGNNEISLMTSDPIELRVWSNYSPGPFHLEIEPQGSCILGQPVITAVGRNPENDDVKLNETNWEIYSAAADNGYIVAGFANPLATIDFQSGIPGDVTLNLYRYDGADWVQSNAYGMTIHQIPEPITLVFLGMGGLLLRRKK